MSRCLRRISAVMMLVATASLLSACVSTTGGVSSSEALVLIDGTEIPCEILEFDSEFVYFEPALAQDRYNYGDYIGRSEVKWIKVFHNNEVKIFNLNDYVNQNTVAIEDEMPEPLQPADQAVRADVLQNEFKRIAAQQTEPSAPAPVTQVQSQAGPGLRLSQVKTDSARKKSGIGLRLPGEIANSSANKLAEAEYDAIADLIVASGAAGLVLYRSEQFAERGVDLARATQTLVEQIKASEEWQKRVQGILAANKIAGEDFAKNYPNVRDNVASQFGFRPQSDSDDYAAFVLYLHLNGGLRSPRKKQQFEEWFGGLAERAFSDILANFDDWYYIVVIQSRE
ncbi:MAG: hypothetical protein H6695_10710 [Deferribacteres bacterium]|nr:hypothetical protein [Deferribacteres bacterium]